MFSSDEKIEISKLITTSKKYPNFCVEVFNNKDKLHNFNCKTLSSAKKLSELLFRLPNRKKVIIKYLKDENNSEIHSILKQQSKKEEKNEDLN